MPHPHPTRRSLLAAALAAPALAPHTTGFVERAFHDWATATRCPAANMALARNGQLIDTLGWGTRAAHARAPVWSLSKSITAACIAGLADDGLLQLDHPLGRTLPGLRPEMAAVTLAQLITHRSGLPGKTAFGPLTPLVIQQLSTRTPDQVAFTDIAAAMRDLVPTAPTGAGFAYSNLNYFFLGQVIEAVARMPYVDACNQRLLRPAGIEGAGLDPRWGRLLWSTGGWLLSPADYLAFAATLASPSGTARTAHAFLTNTPARGAPPGDPLAGYTLGMIWQPTPTGPFMMHNGSWSWTQPGATPPLHENAGSQFRRWPGGLSWCATHDGISLDNEPAAYGSLATAIARLRGMLR